MELYHRRSVETGTADANRLNDIRHLALVIVTIDEMTLFRHLASKRS